MNTSIPNNYYQPKIAQMKALKNTPVSKTHFQHKTDNVQFGQNSTQEKEKKSFLEKNWAGILLAAAGIVGGTIFIKHGLKDLKTGIKKETENTTADTQKAIDKALENNKTIQEINKTKEELIKKNTRSVKKS